VRANGPGGHGIGEIHNPHAKARSDLAKKSGVDDPERDPCTDTNVRHHHRSCRRVPKRKEDPVARVRCVGRLDRSVFHPVPRMLVIGLAQWSNNGPLRIMNGQARADHFGQASTYAEDRLDQICARIEGAEIKL
jgi:hypothetical protein